MSTHTFETATVESIERDGHTRQGAPRFLLQVRKRDGHLIDGKIVSYEISGYREGDLISGSYELSKDASRISFKSIRRFA